MGTYCKNQFYSTIKNIIDRSIPIKKGSLDIVRKVAFYEEIFLDGLVS